jgi:hypothetical protein
MSAENFHELFIKKKSFYFYTEPEVKRRQRRKIGIEMSFEINNSKAAASSRGKS